MESFIVQLDRCLYNADQEYLSDNDDGEEDNNFSLEYSFETGKVYHLKCGYYDEGTVTLQPTCGSAGSQHYECTVCHIKEAETTIPVTGAHRYRAALL